MAIYRYRKIDDNNLESWRENKLWFSPLDKLNDSFEMWCQFNSTGFSAYGSDTQRKGDKFLSEFKEKHKKTSTFCCFSKRSNIPLMWAHYGDGLSGVCIEYDEKILELNGKQLLSDEIHAVDYPKGENLPCCNIYDCHVNDKNGQGDSAYAPAFRALFLTKSQDWSYEEEIRLLWENPAGLNGNDTSQGIPINREAIKSVIFGERADPAKVKRVQDIFGESVPYKTARKSNTHYKIEIS